MERYTNKDATRVDVIPSSATTSTRMSPSRASPRGAVTVSMPAMSSSSSTTSSRHAVDVVVEDVTYVVKNAQASGGGDDDHGKAREGDASERRGEETIALLRGVSSVFERGRVHALMGASGAGRSEERRVGKECRSRWSPYH